MSTLKVTDAVASTKKVEASHHAVKLARINHAKKHADFLASEDRLDECEKALIKDKAAHESIIRSIK